MNKENIENIIYTIYDINMKNVDLPSLNHNLEKVDKQLGFDTVLEKILDYISNKDIEKLDSMIKTMDNISCRTKTITSIKNKWNKNLGKKRPINKVFNDIVGIRIITENNIDNIIGYITEIADNKNYKIEKIDFREKSKANDDGYRGIHIYFMNNPKSFRIEIQIWSKVDAILNFYTHQNIYKVNGDISYALSLRKWIDELPQNEGFKFENYIWEIINNPSKYREKVADILVKNIEENKSLEMTLLEHYMYITNLNIQSKYIIDLKSHLENIPINIEGIETTFSEYIIRRVIEVVEEVV